MKNIITVLVRSLYLQQYIAKIFVVYKVHVFCFPKCSKITLKINTLFNSEEHWGFSQGTFWFFGF